MDNDFINLYHAFKPNDVLVSHHTDMEKIMLEQVYFFIGFYLLLSL